MLKAAKVITGPKERAVRLVATRNLKMARSGLSLVALPAAAPRPGPVEVAGRPIWVSDGVVLTDGALGDLPPWFVGWFLSEGRRS